MPNVEQTIRIYEELAQVCDQQGQPQMHDRFLVLAADVALNAGKAAEAERLRLRLLKQNPHHLLKPFASFAEAVRSDDVRNYVRALRRSHPPESAEQLLQTLRNGEAAISTNAIPADKVPGDSNPAESLGDSLKVYRLKDEGEPIKNEPGPSERPLGTQRPAKENADARSIPPTLSVPRAEPAAALSVGQAAKPRAKPVSSLGLTAAPVSRPLPSSKSSASSSSLSHRNVYSIRPEPPAAPVFDISGEAEGYNRSGSYWVSVVLAALTLLTGLAFGSYTALGPFFPSH